MSEGSSFYITTPIFYVNDAPHIGHAYTEVATDCFARWHRQSGADTWFLTGTDEHGQKVLTAATEHGLAPKEWTNKLVSEAWIPLLDTVNIAHDDFIRTTEERHQTHVQMFLQDLYEKGFIYQGEYDGLYCYGCEEYKPNSDVVLGEGELAGQKVCAIHSKPLEALKEKNYFFKVSAFEQSLLELYEQNPEFIRPESAYNEIVSFVKQGLADLSISRSSFDWGIKIPWDPEHVVYVWCDALLNYITAIGYGQDNKNFERRWPAYHIVGKDILRFHAVIWPALLMAAGLQMPKGVFGHGWLLVNGEKMSKSKLNGIYPHVITDEFGSDAFRYYFARSLVFGQDGSFGWEDFALRYQADLANGLGNLVSRVLAMVVKYCSGSVAAAVTLHPQDEHIRQVVIEAAHNADRAMESFALQSAVIHIWSVVEALNRYITEEKPWERAKDDSPERLHTILYTALEGLRALCVLLAPIIPESMEKLWAMLSVEPYLGSLKDQKPQQVHIWNQIKPGTVLCPGASLFPRHEMKS